MTDLRIRLALDGADQVQAGAQRAGQAMDQLGRSTAQAGRGAQLSGQQMAQVSAQLQDLFVQIQAGGNPMTALLQQGSQLSGVFGGVGNALRAVGSLITPTVALIGGLGATVTAVAAAYAQGSAEADAYRKAIVLSGNAAGVTVGQLQDMARAQAALAGTQGRAAEVLAVIASSGTVAAAQMQAAVDAAIRLERAGGPAAEETAKKFAKLGQEPVRALVELNKAENFLTESLYRQVKVLAEQGNTAEAAAAAQAGYAEEVKRRAEALANSLGTLEKAWQGITGAAKSAWDAMLDIGREDTLAQRAQKVADTLAEARAKLAEAQSGTSRLAGINTDRVAAAQAKRVQLLEAELRYLQLTQAQETRRAASQRESAAAVTATIAAEEAAGKGRERIQREAQAAAARDEALRARAIGLNADYGKSLAELDSARRRGVLTEAQYLQQVQALVAQQPVMIAQTKADTDARAAAAKVAEAQAKAYEQQLAALRKSADSAADQVQKLRDEEQAAGIAAAKNISLAEAIQQVAIARLEEAQARSLDLGEVDALQAEITARRELIELMRSRELRNASQKTAQDAAREWERASQDIERSLTDALLRGFESGKDFARNLRDTFVNLFQTLVLRPLIQPVIGGITGSLGLPGSAQAVPGGGSSPLGSLGQFASLGSAFAGNGFLGSAAGTAQGLFGFGELSSLTGSEALAGGWEALLGGNAAGGAGTLAGAAAAYLAGAGIGIYGGRAISNGYAVGGGSGNSAVNVGTAIGTAIAGPIGAAVGGIIGGLVNRAFGRRPREVTEAGLIGSVGGGDVTGQNFENWRRDGGWFRSDRSGTDLRAIDTEVEQGLDFGAKLIFEQTKAWAQALRLPAEQLAGITSDFRVTLTSDAKANEAAVASVLQGYSDALTLGFTSQLEPFKKSGESIGQVLERLSGSLVNVNGVLSVLGQTALQLSVSGGASASALLDQFGGLQQYQSAATQYLRDYYTEAERTALGTQQLSTALGKVGLALPASRDAYRDLVEAQDLSTESGRQAYAALLQLAPAFAELVPAVAEVGAVVDQTAAQLAEAAARQAEAGRRVLADLAADTGSLQVELLRAQGQGGAANALQRQLDLSGITAGLSAADAAAATAAYDLNAALREQITAAQDAAEAVRQAAAEEARVANERANLEQRILQLQGNTTALRALELAKLDPANRALQERIYALEDEASAAAEAARVANEKQGLEQRILQLQGNTTALRALELAKLDPANRALQERIYALEDEATAAAEVARVSNERQGLEQRILQLQGNTTALRALELAKLDPANRALQERIYALEDEATAAAEVARVSNERQGLEQRILQLQGDTTALRALELAKLDPANRALQERIYALEDEATAAAEAARVSNERQGLEQRILQLQGNTTALRALELAKLDPANRALQERIYALEDEATAAAEVARVSNERQGLEQRILQLQGNTTALRALELAGVDASNRELLAYIFTLEDQQTAARDAAQALDAFNNKLSGLGDTRFDLEQQLLKLQGRDAEAAALLRTRELAKLTEGLTADQAAAVVAAYDYNEALSQQITSLQTAQQAAADLARAQEQAAQQAKAAWQSVADSLFEEVARIRGLINGGPGGLTLAQAQAQFAVATGQARAGDQTAARSLPGLSQTLLELATANAGSLIELNRIRAAIAASLEQTGSGLAGVFGLTIPRLSTGTNLVPRDMLALLHEGEAVVPRPFNPAAGNGPESNAVAAELSALRSEGQVHALAQVRLATETNRLLKRWDADGLPAERDVTA